MVRCNRVTTRVTIKILRELFARFGIPNTIVTDNGTPFTAGEFKELCREKTVEHVTKSPYHLKWMRRKMCRYF